MFHRFGTFLVGLMTVATAVLFAGPDRSWPHERSDIPASSRITWGQLGNGLRYAILPNQTPPGQVSLRLLVLAGSLHENDNERGYAHFVEHMAFNGTRHFPAGELVKFLQRQGTAFGPHINAETTHTHTLYKVNLPENSPNTIAGGLRVLRDFADGVLFEPTEVNRERGVMLSEALTRRTLGQARTFARQEFLYAGTLVPLRFPIGTDSSIKRAKPADLRSYYEAWYRPERMVMVVTGDIDASQLVTLLEGNFASLAARGPARPEPDLGVLSQTSEVRAEFYPDSHSGVKVELGTIRENTHEPDTAQRRRTLFSLEMARAMLARRLERLTEQPERPISGHGTQSEYPFDRFRLFSVTVFGAADKWTNVLATAEQELRRALEHGFAPTELAVEQESKRASVQDLARSAMTTPSSVLADMLLEQIEEDKVFTFPDETKSRVLQNIEQITVDDCRRALVEAWSDSPRYTFVTADSRWGVHSPEKIRAAYEASQVVAVAPPEALKTVTFAYNDFGSPGTVVQKEHVADLDVWLIRFANGVRLNLKRTDRERSRTRFHLRIGTGRLEEPASRPGLGLLAGGLLLGGVGKHNNEELRLALNGRHFDLMLEAAEDAFRFSGEAPSENLSVCLRLVAAFLTDPSFRAEGNEAMKAGLNNIYDSLIQSANGVLSQRIIPYLGGNDSRLGFPPREVAFRYTMEDLAAWLKPALQFGAIEIALVGEFDVEETITEVAKTLGALPARVSKPDLTEQRILKLPRPPQSYIYTYAASDGPSTLILDWPVHEVLTLGERRRLELLATVIQDRLRVQIREKKGETYSPEAFCVWNDAYLGNAHLCCRLDISPKRAKRMMNAVRDLVIELGKNGVSDDELQRAKAQATAKARELVYKNNYWLEAVLADAQERPWRIEAARTLESDTASATKAEIDALAARYLTAKNLFRFIIQPQKPKKS